MAGRGRAPKEPAKRRNHHVPIRGEWTAADGLGWQHGPIPEPPDGLTDASLEAWNVWMRAWFAARWTPGDVPGLRIIVRLYDRVERGEYQRAGELRLWLDTYGITPKGQADRRWARPSEDGPKSVPETNQSGRYAHLSVVDTP